MLITVGLVTATLWAATPAGAASEPHILRWTIGRRAAPLGVAITNEIMPVNFAVTVNLTGRDPSTIHAYLCLDSLRKPEQSGCAHMRRPGSPRPWSYRFTSNLPLHDGLFGPDRHTSMGPYDVRFLVYEGDTFRDGLLIPGGLSLRRGRSIKITVNPYRMRRGERMSLVGSSSIYDWSVPGWRPAPQGQRVTVMYYNAIANEGYDPVAVVRTDEEGKFSYSARQFENGSWKVRQRRNLTVAAGVSNPDAVKIAKQ
jgi:hypothetical protein